VSGVGVVAAWRALPQAQNGAGKTKIAVYKDPTCGCCENWVKHMAASGFDPSVTNSGVPAIKTKYRVPARLQSCHTAVVDGLVIEGHVPAADVRKLLATKPKGVIGLTIPGMPASAPGMDIKPFQPYTVLAFDATGQTSVFARHDRA
jgi:hypothetical protein